MDPSTLTPVHLQNWIAERRSLLQPPVGNAQIWKDREFMVTVVGGPNQRTDWHIDPGEEFFYQLEGDMTLKVMEEGAVREIPIRAGEVFLLPPNVPHSPQRKAGTVGLVIERVRRPEELDHLRWYCGACGGVLYDEAFHLTDLTTQLKPVFDRFYADARNSTCKRCGEVMPAPPA